MKIENRQRILAAIALLAFGILIGDRLLLTPMIEGWKERNRQILEYKQALEKGELLVNRKTAIREQWKEMHDNLLPSNSSAAQDDLLKGFQRWSEKSGISVSGLKPQWRELVDETMVLECRAETFGSLEAVSRFLFELEKDPMAVRVESLEVASRDDRARELSLTLQVSALPLSVESGSRQIP